MRLLCGNEFPATVTISGFMLTAAGLAFVE
jgi:hypothetical protein